MPICHKLGCIFIHIPKTAGTSIETALGVFGDWREENRQTMFGMCQTTAIGGRPLSTPFLQHLTARELREILPATIWSYHKFSVVRNPWDRMVSAYSNKDPHLCQEALKKGWDLQSAQFDDFVELTKNMDHAHLRPQCEYLQDNQGRMLVDSILRWESLSIDFAELSRALNARLSLPHANPSVRGSYREYYSARSRQLVAQRYHDDIAMFGYKY